MQEKQVSKSPLLVHPTGHISFLSQYLVSTSCEVFPLGKFSVPRVFIRVGHIGSLCLALLTFQTPQRKDVHCKLHCLYKQLSQTYQGMVGTFPKPKFPEASAPALSSWDFLSWQSQLLCQVFSAHSLAPLVSPYQTVSGSKSQNSSFFSPALPSETLNWSHWGLF